MMVFGCTSFTSAKLTQTSFFETFCEGIHAGGAAKNKFTRAGIGAGVRWRGGRCIGPEAGAGGSVQRLTPFISMTGAFEGAAATRVAGMVAAGPLDAKGAIAHALFDE